MTSTQKQLNRRDLLAGIGAGAVGLATLSGVSGAFGSSPAYTHYTYAAPNSLVRVAWFETYNGDVLEVQNGSTVTNGTTVLDPDESPAYVENASGPVVTLDNLMPGDEGTLVVGFEAVDTPAQVRLLPQLAATAENGIVEPEVVAGDTTPTTGELQDALLVEVWRDSSLLGGCDGRRGLGDTTITSGTLQHVSDEYGPEGIDIGCLDGGESSCLGLAWRFDPVSADTQTDSVTFDLVCEAVSCGGAQ
ncbi:hypothetical protein [Haloarchaeobius litoreus]|uniref:Tat (Twin-arginine translocation) pathway signal sequence n=1 Tax=Haloarchaeobius litoreus TaxID=755306 RepID=A0ABD6DIT0_9EURY|nr:hypothetical protein [Haloarchaeobius litoreus]